MKQKIKSLLRLAWPYILMVALPILSVVLLSGYIFNNHTQQMIADQNAILDVSVDRVEEKIKSIADLSYLIAENDTVYKYVVNGIAGMENDYNDEQRIQDLLKGISQNDNIAEIYFYDTTNKGIIASSTALSDAQMFFRYSYQIEELTPEEAVERLQSDRWGYGRTEAVRIGGKPKQVIEYCLSVPVGQIGRAHV